MKTEDMTVDILIRCPNDWYGNHTFELYKRVYEDINGQIKLYKGKRCILCGIIKEDKSNDTK